MGTASRYILFAAALLLLPACSMFKEKEKRLEGDRIAILSDIGKLSPSDSLENIPVELPEAIAPESWPQAGGNMRHHTGHVKLASDLSREITTDAGNGHDWPSSLVAAPVTSSDAVYTMDAQNIVTARATNLSHTLWHAELNGDNDNDAIGGGLAYESGRLFVTLAAGKVVALDAKTGQKEWSRSLKTPLRSAPAVLPGMVLVITIDSQLFALDAATGEILWRHRGIQETASLLGTVIPAVDEGRVVVAYPSGEIYALSLRDGDVLWTDSLILPRRTTALGSFTGVGGDPVISNGIVYTVSQNGLLAANDLTSGLRIWEQPVASHSTPWVSGNFLYVVTTARQLVAIYRKDGRIKWVSDLPTHDGAEALNGPYLINGRVLVLGSSGDYYAFDAASGKLQGTRDFISGAVSAVAFTGGKMFICDQSATLHIYE